MKRVVPLLSLAIGACVLIILLSVYRLGTHQGVRPSGDMTVLSRAAEAMDWDVVTSELRKGIDPGPYNNFDGRLNRMSPLHWAAVAGKTEIVKLLLDDGVKVDLRLGDRPDLPGIAAATPLLCAVLGDKRDTVELLLERGADPNATDGKSLSQDSILTHAAERSSTAVVELLIDKGADVNFRNVYSHHPLNSAIVAQRAEIADLLLANGAKPAAEDISDALKFDKGLARRLRQKADPVERMALEGFR